MIVLILFALAAAVTGCQVVGSPDIPATTQAENLEIVHEATRIAQAAQADREAVAATADAVMTEVADLQQANLVLLATVRAGDPPTQGVIVSTDGLGQVPALTPGQRWFTRTGVSQRINEADGCVVSPQITFTMDTPIIYATMRVFNIESGVQLSALWEREGMEMYRDSFVLNRGASEICLWFSIERSEVEFVPGNWTVRLFADGFQLESPLAFTILEPGAS